MTNLWSQVTSPVLDWVDPTTQTVVKFHAKLICPIGSPVPDKVPVAVYFHGMGETATCVMSMRSQWLQVAPEPFVLLAPQKQKHGWWFLDSDTYYGWVDGKLKEDLVGVYCRWLKYVAEIPGSDAERIGLFGWSGGAYAITELLASSECIQVTGASLAGVHGHGQKDISDLPPHLKGVAVQKFTNFLQRLGEHQGVPFLEATHATEDKESKFVNAQEIFKVLSERNEELGYEPLTLRELGTAQQDVKPKAKKNKSHHNYFNASFLRKDLFVALWGGERPPPFEKQDAEDQEWPEASSATQASSATWTAKPAANANGWTANATANANGNGNVHGDDWGAFPGWESMVGMMNAMMWGGGGAGNDDDTCWDMETKGSCPRGASCKYCRASAKRARLM